MIHLQGISFALLDLLVPVTRASAATSFQPGNINTAADWDNGLPGAGNVGAIAVSRTNASTVFGFGVGSITNLTAGGITSADGFLPMRLNEIPASNDTGLSNGSGSREDWTGIYIQPERKCRRPLRRLSKAQQRRHRGRHLPQHHPDPLQPHEFIRLHVRSR